MQLALHKPAAVIPNAFLPTNTNSYNTETLINDKNRSIQYKQSLTI